MTVLAIGNGESRFNLKLTKVKYTTIGCNGIHRDFTPNYLVCVDRRMVTEALEKNFQNKILTRQDWLPQFSKFKQVLPVPSLPFIENKTKADNPFNWGSGPYALLLAAMLDYEVNMIGFDLYGKDKLINNIYKGSTNYDPPSHHAIDPRYWIYQISKIFKSFANTAFTIFQTPDWNIPTQWNLPNVSVDIIDNLKYNNN